MAGIGTLAAGQWEEIQATSPDVQTGGTRGCYVGGDQGGGQHSELNILILIALEIQLILADLTESRKRFYCCFIINQRSIC